MATKSSKSTVIKRKAPTSAQSTRKRPKISIEAAEELEIPKAVKPKKYSENNASSEEDVDQTVALLKGFGSSSSSSGSEDADASDAEVEVADKAQRLDLSLLPDPKLSNGKKDTAKEDTEDPIVLYISRIPHGFHEPQMRSYFSQFGELKRLRLARNKRTGASRHFAFLQFADAEVASIVARTMNNYLLFGHLLKCRALSLEEVERLGGVEGLFKGSGRRWKKVPWNAIERGRIAKTDRQGWAKRIENERRRRTAKMQKLKALGYDFAMPDVRDVESVPVQEDKAIEAGMDEGTLKTITEPPPVEAVQVEVNTPSKKVKVSKQLRSNKT